MKRIQVSGWTRKRLFAAGLGVCSVALIATFALRLLAQQQADKDFQPRRVLAAQPPITEFPIKSVGEAKDALNPSELVLGVTIGKESRAYPINMLTGPQREILNDMLGGKAIAATW
jgi:hypothetical protein